DYYCYSTDNSGNHRVF
nr:immunoglobulin light chain junction region [Macaca mulatta]MOX79306.1 immunoglobulin light chain junction region [Macaca mulatta]MOX80392.1 immunoglobulin light chain junction region [Macaca mulatta]MOX81420.1 immunoglobulin light chain junction region [Macaca mulatta]MOX81595.1 immunoglobulin light chain junction region [Macaca mulatta]